MICQLFLATVVGLALSAPSSIKIDGNLQEALKSRGVANVVVSFADSRHILNSINSNPKLRFASRGAKINFMKARLEDFVKSTQKSVLRLLGGRGTRFSTFWINNKVYIENASEDLVNAIAALPEVNEVREEVIVKLAQPIHEAEGNSTIVTNRVSSIEWGVEKIEASTAWDLPGGNIGEGVVVAAIDSGARHTHEALRKNYRSSYGWFDPYTRTSTPIDSIGHGTHVLGTIAGTGGIGVAPGSKWIACLGCSSDTCSEAALVACGQWVTCPTLPNGESENCEMAPVIVSNSWGGGAGSTWYSSVIESWHAAGIIPVFAMGNAGPYCGTAESPGDNSDVIAVGSTTIDDGASTLSSRGPSRFGTIKPDISAPGSNIKSSWHTGDSAYVSISGTSMATPHVSGVIALLLTNNPNLTYAEVKDILQKNTDRDLMPEPTCGGIKSNQFPNNVYGFGRVNARKSLTATLKGHA